MLSFPVRWRDANWWTGVAFGVLTHLLFAVTVWHLVWFLAGHAPARPEAFRADGQTAMMLIVDTLLAVGFAVPHSLLLLPAVRRRLVGKVVRSELYGCLFCVVTCLALLLTILAWQPSDVVVWAAPRSLQGLVTAGFIASWALLLYSLHLSGLGYQTGFTPWWFWLRGMKQPRRAFVTHSLYRYLRHPVYLSFLGLVWLTPVVTLDRLVLIVIWTGYIAIGSVLKDRRLLHFIGDPYRRYQAGVPGYPGMPLGPLARIPLSADSA